MVDSSKHISAVLIFLFPSLLLMVNATTTAGAPIHGTATESATGSSLTNRISGIDGEYPVKVPQVDRTSNAEQLVFPPTQANKQLQRLEAPPLDDNTKAMSDRPTNKNAPVFTASEKPILLGDGNLEPNSHAPAISSSADNDNVDSSDANPSAFINADTELLDLENQTDLWSPSWNFAIAVILLGVAVFALVLVFGRLHESA